MIIWLGLDLKNQLDLTWPYTGEETEAQGSKVISTNSRSKIVAGLRRESNCP